MTVPTEDDWGPTEEGNLDAAYARRVFLGKTAEAAQQLFRDNVLECAEELRFMPAVPFQYYVMAFRDFVVSQAVVSGALEAADAASSFLRLLITRLEDDAASVEPVLQQLLPAVDAVARHQAQYSADTRIYGDFTELAQQIRSLGGRRTRRSLVNFGASQLIPGVRPT